MWRVVLYWINLLRSCFECHTNHNLNVIPRSVSKTEQILHNSCCFFFLFQCIECYANMYRSLNRICQCVIHFAGIRRNTVACSCILFPLDLSSRMPYIRKIFVMDMIMDDFVFWCLSGDRFIVPFPSLYGNNPQSARAIFVDHYQTIFYMWYYNVVLDSPIAFKWYLLDYFVCRDMWTANTCSGMSLEMIGII